MIGRNIDDGGCACNLKSEGESCIYRSGFRWGVAALMQSEGELSKPSLKTHAQLQAGQLALKPYM